VGAMAITFGDFTKEPAPTTLDVKALLRIIEKKATSDEVNKDGSPKVTAEAKEFASKLVAAGRAMLAA